MRKKKGGLGGRCGLVKKSNLVGRGGLGRVV